MRLTQAAKALCEAYGADWDKTPEVGVTLPGNYPGLPNRTAYREMARAVADALGVSVDD
jgi:hypothetical protein